jgi:hypothetical protein
MAALVAGAEGKGDDGDLPALREVFPGLIDAKSPRISITKGKAGRIGGGAMAVVFRGTLDGKAIAAKTHHAFRNPDDYGQCRAS